MKIQILSKLRDKTTKFTRTKFTKDVAWSLIGTFTLAITGILINIVITKYYETEGLGQYTQALVIYMVLSMASVLGIQTSMVKYAAEYKSNKTVLGKLLISALIIVLPLSLVLTIFIISTLNSNPFVNERIRPIIKSLIIGLPFFSANKVLISFLNGIRQIKSHTLVQSARGISIMFCMLIFVSFKKDLSLFILAYPITEGTLFTFLIIYSKRFYHFSLGNYKKWIITHFSFGLKSVLTGIMDELNNKIDILLIAYILSDHAVGIYTFASQIIKGFLMISSVIQLNFNPIISNLSSQKNTIQLQKLISRIKKVSIAIMTPIILTSLTIYPIFIRVSIRTFSLDSSIWESVSVFYILSIGILTVSVFSFSAGMLSMSGYPEKQLRVVFISLIFNTIVNTLLIPIFGVNGAALATSLFYIFKVTLTNLFSKKVLNVKLF